MKRNSVLLDRWVWRMAWRDSRNSRKRLLLFVSSIVLGVAALVAISSFGANLEQAIDDQAKALLGADLVVSSRGPFDAATETLLEGISTERSSQTSFSSMAYFPRTDGLRLVEVRALKGDFPYYGKLETAPPEAARTFQSGPNILVDDSLMTQFGARVGDEVKLGETVFKISGRLVDVPGESAAFSLAAPRVFIPLQYVPETGLIQVGSRASYRLYLMLPPGEDADKLVEDLKPKFKEERLNFDTVERRKRGLGRAMENLYRFLNLVGFIALLLGSIGIASSIHLYVKQKIDSIAVLRCMGCTSRQTFTIYLIQAAAMGLIGAAAGSLLGVSVQALVPRVLQDFLPLSIPFSISLGAVLQGAGIGLGMAILFALFPLLPIRKVSPLLAIRSEFEGKPAKWDRLRLALGGVTAAAICLFAVAQTREPLVGLFFFLGLLAAFLLLAGAAKLIVWGVKKSFPSSWSYVWRQGLANLYRPQNQTLVLVLVLGLGTFLILTLHLVQQTLLSQAELTGRGSNPNLVFFDIQTDQKPALIDLLKAQKAPILQDVPIVTMRLTALKGQSVEELRDDENRRQPRWALTREYRSTYRDHMTDTEKTISGQWVGRVDPDTRPVPISLEKGIAEELEVGVGDSLTFDVQGVPVETRVAGIRSVEWGRVQPNFFAVFPAGVLEDAPQFHVVVTRTDSAAESGRLQRAVVSRFPNVSAIDLALVLNTVDAILSRVAFVIRFMALFSFFTGLTVLIGAVVTSRYQRMKESVLLRTLGASRRQIFKIMVVEYLFLGFFASLTGLLLALGAGWGLAYFVFETPFNPALGSTLLTLAGVVGLTILIGVFNSRSVIGRPPLEILRANT